ncbi:hypothetical protein BK659_04955 [Pseudomonas brassicacearum]|uniref:Uncharacterized protein n=1 Tax=Pseudomonas brassicacearum TaxID=930166 RepID=A0A423HCE6_9PSED|nr:hypothetical protein [Pseudomonas brassicacearum]RON10864.1 hypothetical protein BK659_04955 [Pseudomonas brassicacearum]
MDYLVGMKACINVIGLCLNMGGVIMLFFWSLPQPSPDANTGRILEDGTNMEDGRTAGEHRAEAARKKLKSKVIAYAALTLLLAGFGCQLFAAV